MSGIASVDLAHRRRYGARPQTDFGTVTVLDREPGAGGLQVHTEADGWATRPTIRPR
jgi:hypothetical protein